MSLLKKTVLFLLVSSLFPTAASADLHISEFMAINESTLMDSDGDYGDWIEIHNASTSAVNMAGWFLTDNSNDLEKWQFPGILIEGGAHLVVFASDKDRRNPRAELHTNFKLSGGGEYLALVRPDGSVVDEYAPEYPPQVADVSYGTVLRGADTLLGQGAPAYANSPGSEAEFLSDYAGWNTLGFSNASTSATVNVSWKASTTWRNTDGTIDDEHKLAYGYLDDGNTGTGDGLQVVFSGIPYAEYKVYGLYASDGSNGGSAMQGLDFNVNGTWAYGGSSPLATTVYGNIDLNYANHGEYWTRTEPGSVIGNYWVVESTGSTCSVTGVIKSGASRGSLTAVIIEPADALEGAVIAVNFADSDSRSFSGGQNIGPLPLDSANWHSTINRDSGSLKEGAMDIDVVVSGWQPGHTGIGYDRNSGYGSLIGSGGNIEALTYNVNPSAFIRIPFAVTDTSLTRLTLNMKYDDGFRAYLNGVAVAEDAAPSPAGWNSAATFNRDELLNEDWTSFDLSSYIPLLVSGENLLAIQAFNVGQGSSDLLVLPELHAIYDVARTSSYLYTATPGSENSPGSSEIGPVFRSTTDCPPRPDGGAGAPSLVITSKVVAALHPIQSVTLHYRCMFDPETSITMTPIGDDLYIASIPVAGLGAGQMVRWRVEASDTQGGKTTNPPYYDPEDYEQYFGTSTIDLSYTNSLLPVVEWFVEDYGAANTDGGTRCSIFYLDRFYDNVFIKRRGGSTRNFIKKSLKLDFNKDNRFVYKEGEDKVKDLRWMQNWADKTKVHNTMSHETAARVGAAHHFCFPVRIQRNGVFERITEFMENDDNRWLERLGRDPEGALLKMFSETGGEKKTRRPQYPYYEVTQAEAAADDAAKNSLFNSLDVGNSVDARRLYMYDNMNIPDCINYLVAANLFSHQDHGHKNYYIYRDTNQTGEWSIFLWDLDLTWGRNWTQTTGYLSDILYADNPLDFETPLQYKVYNRIYKAFHEAPELREMYFRRLRTCMDEILQSAGTPEQEKQLEARFDYWLDLVDPEGVATSDADLDRTKWGYWGTDRTVREEWARTKLEYMNPRREYLFNENPSALMIFGESAPEMQPADTGVQIEMADFLPASGNAMEEYFTLLNTNDYAVDISGWSVTGAVEHVFAPGTVIPSGGGVSQNIGRLFVARESSSFRARAAGPSGGKYCMVQGGYKGQLSARGETLVLLDKDDRIVDQFSYAGTPTDAQQYLRVSEIMYAPADPTPQELALQPYLLKTDFEFIELVNTGPAPIDLSGAQFTEGIQFTFPQGFSIPDGEYVIVAANTNAFPLRYGSAAVVAGQYDGYLDNSGETIVLLDSAGEKVLDFSYNDAWYPFTDGFNFSLVVVDEGADWNTWGDAAIWRRSATVFGSPGSADPAPPVIGAVLVNEVLTHTDLPQVDSIELYNPEEASVDIGGWYLSDDYDLPRKFRIPDGTVLTAGGYMVFDESDFFIDENDPASFQLSSEGDEVWLFSGDVHGNLTGYCHGFEFGAAQNGVSFGRYVTTVGETHYPAQSELTLGFANAGPRTGPIVISEIMYHPADLAGTNNVRDEYIELTNISGVDVPLYDPLAANNTWRVRNAVDFDFPQGALLESGQRLLLVGFDPLDAGTLGAFRAAYGLDSEIAVYGPWSGHLNNTGETISLRWPDSPNIESVPYVVAEEVRYDSVEPWPAEAAGTGSSLQRIELDAYADDPDNWYASAPRPAQPADLALDRDSDTMKDWEEWKSRTDPLDPESYMHLGPPVFTQSGHLNLYLHTVSGRRYVLESTTNLVTQPFTPLIGPINAVGDMTVITITDPDVPACFYRMRLDP